MQGRFDSLRIARHGTRGRNQTWARQPRTDPALRRCDGAGAFLQHGLSEIAIGNAHFLSQLQQIGLGKAVADIALASLELRRALNDPLDSRAIEQGATWPGGNAFAHFLARSSAGAVTGAVRGVGMPVVD